MKRQYILIVASSCLMICHLNCKKPIDIEAPATSISDGNVYNSNATAISVLTGIYSKLGYGSEASATGYGSLSLLCGLVADEFTLFGGVSNQTLLAYYKNELNENILINHWKELYSYIYNCNSAIEGLNNSANLSPNIQKQLTGEAKFMRAFSYLSG